LGLFEKEPAEAAGRPGREAPSSSLPIRGDGPQSNFPRISGEVGKGIPRDPHGRRTPAIGDISMAEALG
jgi:hypothetical protein